MKTKYFVVINIDFYTFLVYYQNTHDIKKIVHRIYRINKQCYLSRHKGIYYFKYCTLYNVITEVRSLFAICHFFRSLSSVHHFPIYQHEIIHMNNDYKWFILHCVTLHITQLESSVQFVIFLFYNHLFEPQQWKHFTTIQQRRVEIWGPYV